MRDDWGYGVPISMFFTAVLFVIEIVRWILD